MAVVGEFIQPDPHGSECRGLRGGTALWSEERRQHFNRVAGECGENLRAVDGFAASGWVNERISEMNREDLVERWNGYCSAYVPEKPKGFDPEAYVFDAEGLQVPANLSKQMVAGDRLVKLNFHQKSAERGLGSFERSPNRMEELTKFLRNGTLRMAFGYEIGKGDDVHVVGDAASVAGRDIWFIGDVHGDILAFRSAMAFIASNSLRRPVYVFLGDLFDRNPFGLNVLIEAMALLRDDPDSVFFIAGNHDDGLEWTDAGFSSRITPHQFSDELNAFGEETTKEFVKEYVRLAKKLPVGLVLPNGIFATHGGVPSRPERAVKNIWEGKDAKGIKRLIAEKRSEFLCNRFQKDVSSGTKISPDFSWVEIINFGEAIETAYGVPVRSMVRGHDHCDLCRHDWARSSFEGNDNCPPEKAAKVRDVLTMTSMVMLYKEESLPGFLQHKTSFPTVARYNAQDVKPDVFTISLDSSAALQYCDEAHKPIKVEQARIFAGRKTVVEADRARMRAEQDALEKELNAARKKLGDLDKAVLESEKSFGSWKKRKEELAARPVADTKRILDLKEEVEKIRERLKKRRLEREERDRREKRGEITITRLDDLGDAFKRGMQRISCSTDEDLESAIGGLQEKIRQEQEAEKAKDPKFCEAVAGVEAASQALDRNRQLQVQCSARLADLEKRQAEIISELNKINDELARCNEAERLLQREGK